jgi:hypothetical protein
MRRHLILRAAFILGVSAPAARAQEAEPPKHANYEFEFSTVDVEDAHRTAVTKGLEWIARQQCTTCHSDPHGKDVALAGTWLSKQECVRCHFTVPGQPLAGSDENATTSGIRSLVTRLNETPANAESSATATLLAGIRDAAGILPRACTRNAPAGKLVTYLGVGVAPVPELLRRHVKLPAEMGLLVETVDQDSPAQNTGIERYDILEKINEQLLVNQEQFSVLIRSYRPGTQITLELIRANQPQTVSATLVEREVAAGEAMGGGNAVADLDNDGFVDVLVANTRQHPYIEIDRGQGSDVRHQPVTAAEGATSAPTNDNGAGAAVDGFGTHERAQVTYLGVQTSAPKAALAGQLKLPEGLFLLVDGVDTGSPAEAAGLGAADVLQQLDDQVLMNTDQLGVLIRSRKPGDEVTLTLIRSGQQTKVRATLGHRDAPGAAMNGYLSVYREALAGSDRDLANFHNAAIADDWRLYGRYAIDLFDASAPSASDEEFVRRVYLDLVGSAPSSEEIKAFLDDSRTDKRQRLIDDLLSRPDVFAKFKGVSSLEWSDAEHALRLTSQQGANRRLLAKDATGNVLFEGQVDTDDERGRLPTAIAAKLALMLEGIDRRQAPPDVHTALDRVVSITAAEASLEQVVQTLRKETGVNIVVNAKALKSAGVDASLTFALHDVKLSTALKTIAMLLDGTGKAVGYTVDDGVIVISTK